MTVLRLSPIEDDEFNGLVEPIIPALRLHCYHLLGSLDDAEDMVQEALVRAWRHSDRLDSQAGLRPWLFRIATNASLDLLDRRRRRPKATLDESLGWVDPIPDRWLGSGRDGDPVDALLRQEAVSLAFLTAVQVLPPRQRAMLVLRDVLEWPAGDVAEAIGTSLAAVHSGVRRARMAIRERSPDSPAPVPQAWAVARRYLDAWERADSTGLANLLAADARMAMPPDPRVFVGRQAILQYFTSIFDQPEDSRIRLAPTLANGGPAFVVLTPETASTKLRRIGLKVMLIHGRQITEIRGYMRPDLAARFDIATQPGPTAQAARDRRCW